MTLVTCPVCAGQGRVGVDRDGHPNGARDNYTYPQYIAQGWMECFNCGGNTMSARGTGKVRVDPATGLGCVHDYTCSSDNFRCLTDHVCRKCGDRYQIDSGD